MSVWTWKSFSDIRLGLGRLLLALWRCRNERAGKPENKEAYSCCGKVSKVIYNNKKDDRGIRTYERFV